MVMVNPRTSNSDLVTRLSSGGDYLRGRVSSQYNPSILSLAFRSSLQLPSSEKAALPDQDRD